MENNQTLPPITVAPGGGLTVSLAETTATVYILTGEKLDSISYLNTSNAVYLAAAGLCGGIFATLITTLFTTPLSDPMVHAIFVLGPFGFGILTIVFGVLFAVDLQRSARTLREIRSKKTTAVMPTVK
jgi:multisubunit Na+/H+ antiporter MnhB subunit